MSDIEWDDVVSSIDAAFALGVSKSTFSNWKTRHKSFPQPLSTVAQGTVSLYSMRAIKKWHANHTGGK